MTDEGGREKKEEERRERYEVNRREMEKEKVKRGIIHRINERQRGSRMERRRNIR